MTSQENSDQTCCWISTVAPEDASDELGEMYRALGSTHGKIHNLYKAFALQPKPLIAADQHYRDILHNEKNASDPWFLELLASQAAIIAECDYALTNHGANFISLLGDESKGQQMLQAVREDQFDSNPLFSVKQAALLEYGARLCRSPESMREEDITTLRMTGVTDVEILEAVQATACFAYWVRFINALGIQIGNESVGLFDKNGERRK